MGQKLIIGPINRGLRTDRKPFVIDNDSFPTLINAYQWRGRIKRKRGTTFYGRLQRQLTASGNLVSGHITLTFPIAPGSINIVGGTDGTTYTDPAKNGLLVATGGTGTGGSINYATGLLTITGGGAETITGTYSYYPCLPVMGLEDFADVSLPYPTCIGFDTVYSYLVGTTQPSFITDISFYKNPSTGAYTGYTTKTNKTPLTWNGADYQQFWTVNYQGVLWATNGVPVPFSTGSSIGMQFVGASGISSATQTSATTVDFVIPSTPLVVGDFVFANEFTGTSGNTLNWQTGYVTNVVGTTYTVKFPNANIGGAGLTPGILQYLTNRSDNTKDCIRWYDGTGWVNFMPPLSQFASSIANQQPLQYYLVGAKMIVPFKDRLLFFGAVIQTSSPGAVPIYLQDTVVYSLNGTAFYTASFSGDVLTPEDILSILVPTNQSAQPYAYFTDQIGFGGWASAGIDQAITTVNPNEDALIVGFNNSIQTRFVYTNEDIFPFSFYIINAELGSGSTFSAINMDEGVISRGPRGFIITSQTSCQRIDTQILDQIFEIKNTENGAERFSAQRDFQNEWIYFTYPSNQSEYKYPTQTLLYNYREDTWAIFNESYTTYGQIRFTTGFIWATVGDTYARWELWNVPWNSGQSTLLQPMVIAGNAQGFVIVFDQSTDEEPSLYISDITTGIVTSPNHCLSTGDYIIISGCLGTIGPLINGKIYSVTVLTSDTFTTNPPLPTGTYLGAGLITRLYVPQIASKEFPTAWELGRKTRIGPQQYLFSATDNAKVQLQLFLSTADATPYNSSQIGNTGLIYTQTLYTCPESTNLGLTPLNTNLQMIAYPNNEGITNQQQIWHRMNTSLLGDTVQFGFTLSDDMMREIDSDGNPINAMAEIEFHAAILNLNPSGLLA